MFVKKINIFFSVFFDLWAMEKEKKRKIKTNVRTPAKRACPGREAASRLVSGGVLVNLGYWLGDDGWFFGGGGEMLFVFSIYFCDLFDFF